MLLQLLNKHINKQTTISPNWIIQFYRAAPGWDALAIRADSSAPALLHSSSNMFPRCGREQKGAEKPLMIVTGLELMLKPIDAE